MTRQDQGLRRTDKCLAYLLVDGDDVGRVGRLPWPRQLVRHRLLTLCIRGSWRKRNSCVICTWRDAYHSHGLVPRRGRGGSGSERFAMRSGVSTHNDHGYRISHSLRLCSDRRRLCSSRRLSDRRCRCRYGNDRDGGHSRLLLIQYDRLIRELRRVHEAMVDLTELGHQCRRRRGHLVDVCPDGLEGGVAFGGEVAARSILRDGNVRGLACVLLHPERCKCVIRRGRTEGVTGGASREARWGFCFFRGLTVVGCRND